MANDYTNVAQPDIDDDLYQEQRRSYSGIGYDSRAGMFYVSADNEPSGTLPETFALQPSGENYETRALPIVPLAWRKRLIATDDDGQVRFYSPFTRRADMIGRVRRHVQALVLVPGIAEPMLFGMKGMVSTASWDNPARGKRLQQFGPGVESLLADEQAEARRQGLRLPAFAYQLTLEPLEPLVVGSGRNTSQARPFTATAIRFLGTEATASNAALCREIDTAAWIAEWNYGTAGATQATDDEPDYEAAEAPAVVQDEIPF